MIAQIGSRALLLGVILLAWWNALTDAAGMSPMLDGLARAGRVMPFDTAPARFAVIWIVMLAAMMLPGFIAGMVADRGRELPPPLTSAAFASGYLVPWIPTATVAFGVLTLLSAVSQPDIRLDRIGGAVITVAGAYQLTGYKRRLLTHYGGDAQTISVAAALGTGLSHGLRCLSSSWALMSVLLVVGVMNLPWMAMIGAICLAEKAFPQRVAIATTVGLALVGLGLAVVTHPQALHAIAAS